MSKETISRHLGTSPMIDGEHNELVQLIQEGSRIIGAFVRNCPFERPAMRYLEVNGPVSRCSCGSNPHHAQCDLGTGYANALEVLSSREIDREEFDELTGLAKARREMGWTL